MATSLSRYWFPLEQGTECAPIDNRVSRSREVVFPVESSSRVRGEGVVGIHQQTVSDKIADFMENAKVGDSHIFRNFDDEKSDRVRVGHRSE